jgi:3',5'-cyclic AMP phosphodiesterase CpdA
MSEDQPKPLARARARIEAGRADAELWFYEEVKKDKTRKELDETLFGYIFHVFFVFADELYDAALELDWTADEVRHRIEQGLESVINEAFNSKHYSRNAIDGHFWKGGFRTRAADVIRSSDDWRGIQEKLKELAERQAENCVEVAPKVIGGGTRRLHTTVASPLAARRMEAFLESRGIGQTEFAGRAGTTDRTLRRFRQTGKVRRDIFDAIAKAMGTTREALLKPE